MKKIEMNKLYSTVYDVVEDIAIDLTVVLYDQQGRIIYERGIDTGVDVCIEHFYNYHENGKEKLFLITRNNYPTYKRETSLDDVGRVCQRTTTDSDDSITIIEGFSYCKCENGDLVIIQHARTEHYDPDGDVDDVNTHIVVNGFRKNGDYFNPDNYWYLS